MSADLDGPERGGLTQQDFNRLDELVCLAAKFGGIDYHRGLAEFMAKHWCDIKQLLDPEISGKSTAEQSLAELDSLLTSARLPDDPQQRTLEALDYSLVARVAIVIQQRDEARQECERIRSALSHAAFALWGDGKHKREAAEKDFAAIMQELGLDWNGEKIDVALAREETG